MCRPRRRAGQLPAEERPVPPDGPSCASTCAIWSLPDQPQTSGTILNGWVNGSKGFTINGSDTGAGVSATSTWANGQLIDVAIPCSPDAERLRPCPATGSDSGTYNVAATPFHAGEQRPAGLRLVNTATTLRSPAGISLLSRSTRSRLQAPASPSALPAGENWRRDNSFDLSWSNPDQGQNAGADHRSDASVLSPRAVLEVGSAYYPGDEISAIEDLEVPDKGEMGRLWCYLQGRRRGTSGRLPIRVAAYLCASMTRSQSHRHQIYRQRLDQRARPGCLGTLGALGSRAYRCSFPHRGSGDTESPFNTSADSDPCSGAADPRACSGPSHRGWGRTNRSREAEV